MRVTAPWRDRLLDRLNSPLVQTGVISLIIVNAILFGLQTSKSVMASGAGPILNALDMAILAVFVAELGLRLVAAGRRFFGDAWSVFDLTVVTLAFIPATGSLSALRALRVMRLMRLISAVPSLRAVVTGLLRALPGLSSIAILLLLIVYVSAVIATNLYSDISPDYFGTLGGTMLTLFQIMTLEGWAEILRDILKTDPTAWLFFIAFILSTTFTMLNLFIGVIVEGMQATRESHDRKEEQRKAKQAQDQFTILAAGEAAIEQELGRLRREIAALRQALETRPSQS